MVWFSNGWFYSYKLVKTILEIKWPFDFWSGFQMAIQKMDYFLQQDGSQKYSGIRMAGSS
jgi:hypothetical protein